MSKTKKPFVDFRAIRSQITMEQVLQHYGVLDTLKRSGTRLSGPCPIHNGSNPTQFRVDTEKNVWNCFSECQHGGNVLDFITRKENITIHEAALKACEWFNLSVDEFSNDEMAEHEPAAPNKSGAQPQRANTPKAAPAAADNTPNKVLKFQLEKLDCGHAYFEQRGINQDTIAHFGLGYFPGERGLMVGHVVIPIHNANGGLVAYAGRWPGDPPDGTPKYKLPTGFKKGLELFNIHRAIKEPADKALVIVEGFFDAIKLHQNGCRKIVALMGSSMSAAQEELIRQHIKQDGRVIVMLDEDDAGRNGRDEITARLSKFCFVKTHVFAEPNTQPEQLAAEDVQKILEGVP